MPTKIIKIYFLLVTFIVSCLIMKPVFSMVYHTKLWTSAIVLGSFSDNPKLKYYYEPQIRFIDDSYKFNQFLFLTGLGYQINPNMVLLAGPGWIITENTQGVTNNEFRIWEQLNWNILPNQSLSLISRTRLEQNQRINNAGVAVVLRERMWLRIPFKNWEGHSLSLFDEVFFNLTQPKWTTQRFFSQNRAFLGIGTQLSPSTILDVGYLNQYQLTSPIQLSNVLLVTFTVTF